MRYPPRTLAVWTAVWLLTRAALASAAEEPPAAEEEPVVEEEAPASADATEEASAAEEEEVAAEPILDEQVEEAVDTVVEVDKTSVEGLLLVRQRSASAGDSVGRAEITKANDRNAAEAAKRVVGANIEGSRFLFVRGLGERYTNALLDGFPLPSPEPDRQAVPLDLFPSQILDGLSIVKTFTPDVPGDFAGGSIRIDTRRVPDELTLAGSFSLGFNTQATFAQLLSYDGGSTDWLGIDDGTRALPEGLPRGKVARGVEDEHGELITRDRIADYGVLLNSPLTVRRTLGPPAHSGNIVAANSWPLGSWGKVGVMAAIVYDRRFERRVDGVLRNYGVGSDGEEGLIDGLDRLNNLRYERGTDKVSWGVLGGVTLEIGDDHRVSLSGLHTRASDNEVTILEGNHDERGGAVVHDTRLSFVSRALTFGELHGESVVHPLNGLKIGYGVGVARASRDEPDSRGAVYQLDGTLGLFAFEDDSSSGSHFFSEQGETTVTGKLDLTQPLLADRERLSLKIGAFGSARRRDFEARRFRFRPDRDGAPDGFDTCARPYALECPDKLFSDENIRGGFLELEENTAGNDGYQAGLDVYAGYAMLDAKLTPELRLVLGPRVEISSQTITPFDPVNPDAERTTSTLDDVTILPAATLVWSPIPRANLRLAVGRTVARPQLREIAPFAFTDYFGDAQVRGNPELVNTSIVNADARFELFPTAREVLAVSAFYKRFSDPIEQVLDPSSGNGIISYENGVGADLFGVELEARKSLEVLTPALRPLSLIANVTFSHSRVSIDPERAAALTNASRPLSLQAPYVANVALDFDYEPTGTRARVLYNLVGPRLALVGANGIPDVYERPRHGLDVTLGQKIGEHVEVRGSASNLIDLPIERAHETESGEALRESYSLGRSFSLGVGLTY